MSDALRDAVRHAESFARNVELLLDVAQDVIGARARETGLQRLQDMADRAAATCAEARNMQAVCARAMHPKPRKPRARRAKEGKADG